MLGLIGKTLGRYQLLEQVGQGGMSSVFKALDLPAGKHVAVKILSPYIAHEQRFRARFAREIKLLRRMHHPNIVPVIDFGEAEGFTYIVMPYIGTGTLLDRLQQGPLDVQTGARVTAQLASALGTAHAMGVIHRDVKPSNVLLDQEGNALLSDFSFAHHQEASQNLTGSALIGTPAYMSPEQCRGDPIDARSDQYSFAIMLYQLCTGKLPFEADTPMAVALKHVNEPLPRPREVNPNLPEQVDAVLIRALAKDRDLRYASVAELNDEFQKAIAQGIEKKGRKTRTPIFDRSTQLYEKYQSVDGKGRPWYRRRTTATAAVVLGLLMCPLSAWAMSVLPGLNGTPGQGTPMVYVWTPTGLAATLAALQTANAPAEGTQVAPGHVDTVVAATMAAMGPVVDGPTTIPTATPTGWIWNPQPTPTPTRTLRSGETPPTATRTPAPSTSQPTATDEVRPTATSQPTDTIAPATNTPSAPTNTPSAPTNAPQPTCWPPGHCKAPTPTP